jgi:hypothetical protein
MSTEIIEESVEQSPLERLIQQTDGDIEKIWDYVSASLAFLTLRAAMDAPFIIRNSNEAEAVVAFAVGEDAAALVEALPDNFKDFNDPIDENKATEFLSDVDPGDEQPDHEPAA